MVFQGISGAFLYFLVQFGNFGAFFELFGNFGKLWILLHTFRYFFCFGNMAENEPEEDLQVEDTDSDTQSISSNDDDLPDLIDPSLVNVYDY